MGAAGIGEATALNVARAEHDATFAMNQKIGDIATHLDTGGDTMSGVVLCLVKERSAQSPR